MIANGRKRGFTMIEMLAVIAIIMTLVALALPNYISMMKGRKWMAAMTNVQAMLTRARALAANLRTDISVEFKFLGANGDSGVQMWLESESGLIENMPDITTYLAQMQAANSSNEPTATACNRFLNNSIWFASGANNGGNSAPFDPTHTLAVCTPLPSGQANDAIGIFYGDNAHQSDCVTIGNGVTIDNSTAWSPNFINYDAWRTNPHDITKDYGKDDTLDVRMGPHGALVQSVEPTLCFREVGFTNQRRQMNIVRCTARLVPKW